MMMVIIRVGTEIYDILFFKFFCFLILFPFLSIHVFNEKETKKEEHY